MVIEWRKCWFFAENSEWKMARFRGLQTLSKHSIIYNPFNLCSRHFNSHQFKSEREPKNWTAVEQLFRPQTRKVSSVFAVWVLSYSCFIGCLQQFPSRKLTQLAMPEHLSEAFRQKRPAKWRFCSLLDFGCFVTLYYCFVCSGIPFRMASCSSQLLTKSSLSLSTCSTRGQPKLLHTHSKCMPIELNVLMHFGPNNIWCVLESAFRRQDEKIAWQLFSASMESEASESKWNIKFRVHCERREPILFNEWISN